MSQICKWSLPPAVAGGGSGCCGWFGRFGVPLLGIGAGALPGLGDVLRAEECLDRHDAGVG
jgi:hypothetical protein